MTDSTTANVVGRVLWGVAAAVYVCGVLFITLVPMPWATEGAQVEHGVLDLRSWLLRSTWTTGSPREAFANIALFVPVGFLAGRVAPWLGVAAAVVLTWTIEIVQIPLPDRISDPRDLVANAVGGVIGVALALAMRRRPRDPEPRIAEG